MSGVGMRRSTFFIFLVGFFMISNPFAMAYAYLDPGSGSMLLQLLLGGTAGVVVIVKLYWERLRNFLSRKDPPGHPPSSTD